MDSVGSHGTGYFPQLERMPRHNHDGTGGMHMYMPWWKFDRKNDFPRGYHIELGGGPEMPDVGMFGGLCDREEGYGRGLKQRARQTYGTTISFAGRGEMIPNPDSYCEIDPSAVDRMGNSGAEVSLQVERIRIAAGEGYAGDVFRSIVETAGGEYLTKTDIDGPYPYGILAGGRIIHEVGTARMGADPKTSVLNGYCQAHDVNNLFVMDGAPMVTNPDKNPTLTIMALAWRASEYLAGSRPRKEICRSREEMNSPRRRAAP